MAQVLPKLPPLDAPDEAQPPGGVLSASSGGLARLRFRRDDLKRCLRDNGGANGEPIVGEELAFMEGRLFELERSIALFEGQSG